MPFNRGMLKDKLIEIEKDSFKVPEGLNLSEIASDMMSHIGDTDPILRDSLIYETFCNWSLNGMFTPGQLKMLLYTAIDEKHLFYRACETGTDSVFTRSFSALLIAVIIFVHRRDAILTDEDLKEVLKKVLEYAYIEKDVRGYVVDKGWAHSAAHTADVLDELSQCNTLTFKDLQDILQAIKSKVCINYYAYINHEDERLSIALMSIINRKLVEEQEMVCWIKSFENIEKVNRFPEDHNLTMNIKNFLRSLYFRLLKENNTGIISETIKETLYNIVAY